MTTALHPDRILRDLSDQWAQLDREQADSGGVLRACAMTLVVTAAVTAGDEADAAQVRQTLGVLMHDHPSRAVIVKMRDGAEFDARVFAECWRPFGSAQQICSEGVEILSDGVRLEEAAQLLVPLKVPDLPAVLWCRGASVFQLPRLRYIISAGRQNHRRFFHGFASGSGLGPVARTARPRLPRRGSALDPADRLEGNSGAPVRRRSAQRARNRLRAPALRRRHSLHLRAVFRRLDRGRRAACARLSGQRTG